MAFFLTPLIASALATSAEVGAGASTLAAATGAAAAPEVLAAGALTGAGTTAANVVALGTVASVGSSAGQARSSHVAAQAIEGANKARKAKAKLAAGRERRRIVREAQSARAGVVAQASSQGVESGSTARIGATQDIASQEARNISFLDQSTDLGNRGSAFLDKAATFSQRANLFKSFGNISNQFLKEPASG